MSDFIVPDCQIRKVNGRIYGAGSRIPNYSEDDCETKAIQIEPAKPITETSEKKEDTPSVSYSRKSKSKNKKRGLRESISAEQLKDDDIDGIVDDLTTNLS